MDREGTFNVDKERGLLILEDGEGREDYFTILDQLVVQGARYVILVREDQEEEAEEGGVLRVEMRDGEEVWSIVEDDEEIFMVQRALEERELVDEP